VLCPLLAICGPGPMSRPQSFGRRNCHSLYRRPILDIFSRSGDIRDQSLKLDIRDQSLKLSKIDRNLHVFGPQIFLGECRPNFCTCIIKLGQIPTMWQSFRAIGRGNSENGGRKKRRTSRAFYKSSRTTVMGGLKMYLSTSTSTKYRISANTNHYH